MSEEVVKSVYFDQSDIIKGIMKLCDIERFDADLTYGNGSFYKKIPEPIRRFDIDSTLEGVEVYNSCDVYCVDDNEFSSVIFDPPFLTYIRAARKGNGSMVMAGRFSGYWAYSELEDHYIGTIKECSRILKKKGIFVIKCQDIIHNHKMHCTHLNVINWASKFFRLKDLYILPAKSRMPSPNRIGQQKHARVFHSYFLVFERI